MAMMMVPGRRGVSYCRNSVMSTYRPPDRCSVLCADQRQPRTHRPRPCIPRPPSQGRKLLAASRHLQSVEFPRRHPLRRPRTYLSLSQKRTTPLSSRSRRKRKRQGSGQRRYMIIRARCADARSPHCLSLSLSPLVNDGGADCFRTLFRAILCRRRAICIYKWGTGYS
jgi:hypothetical protein